MFIALLGPVFGRLQGREVPLGAPRQQAIAAMLACSAGKVVLKEHLIDGLWGDNPPKSAEQSVYTYVAGLRGVLEPERGSRGEPRILVGVPGGYALRVDPLHVDCVAFSGRLDEAARRRAENDFDGCLRCLDEALALWRGPALPGVPGPFAEARRLHLDELRVTAMERRAEVMVELGRHQEVLPTLLGLVAEQPLREGLRESLMRALHLDGRQAEALEVFREGERLLAEELGVDPGERLRACRDAILHGQTPRSADPAHEGHPAHPAATVPAVVAAVTVPRQLPRDLLGFVGRTTEQLRVRSHLAPWDEAPPTPVVAISGPPGAGKSALAVHVAHAVGHRFPDGQLYVNLRGGTPGVKRLAPSEALGRLLRALGTAPERVPLDLDEAAALWRGLLSGRRVLVLLDDAANLAQVRPLLSVPAGCAVLVTSRETLTPADDCVQVRLGTLRESEAVTMLARLTDAGRTSADPAATTRLVRLCDGLPLALRIAGARLASRPDWSVAMLVDRLADEQRRLHELEYGDLAVRSGLTASWQALNDSDHPTDRTAAKLLVLLALVRVPDVSTRVAAALLDTPAAEAERALDRLVDANLVERGRAWHYQMHDLVRLFAGEHAVTDRVACLDRVLGYYLVSVEHATRLMDPHRVQADIPAVQMRPHPLTGRDEAHDWLNAEEPNLVAAAAQAMDDPDERIARLGAALSIALRWFHRHSYRLVDMISLCQRALAVARRLSDDTMALEAHGGIASGFGHQGQADTAVRHLTEELRLARRLGDRFAEQRALGNLANSYVDVGRHDLTLRHAMAQLRIATEIGSQVGQRYALLMAGHANGRLRRYDAAEECLSSALTMAREVGDLGHEGAILGALGLVKVDRGDLEAGVEALSSGLALARTVKSLNTEMNCLIALARAHRLLGRPRRARAFLSEAISMSRALQSAEFSRLVAEEREAQGAVDALPLAGLV
ncbi:BTAD domain-containing putative transcriptional regulator [Nonomuraea sp. NPDC059194]|uniref:AfsR/SARP family transcriptional regulator n=1 Tax=Nonomuraea sp. NPDC059194 TaxID=3346764 RepID=UPI0036B6B1D0